MLHGILIGACEWALFTRIDASIAEDFRQAGCGRCGCRLHAADYARKPRGLGFSRGESFTRFSFCCGSEGCRRRSTPPSVRNFGSRVYASGCFLVVSALSGGCSAAAARKLRRRLGIDRCVKLGNWAALGDSKRFSRACRAASCKLLGS